MKKYKHIKIGEFKASIIKEGKNHVVLKIEELIKIKGGMMSKDVKVGDEIRFIKNKYHGKK